MTRRIFSLSYKVLTIASLATGIMLNVVQTTSIKSILSYYTLQSNIICFFGFICFFTLECMKKDDSYKTDMYYLVKGAIMIAIFITAIVYRFALAPYQFEMDSLQRAVAQKEIANLLVHTISPFLVIFDYFLFDEKGKFRCFYPIMWLGIPLNYVLYVYLYSFTGGKFYSIGGSKHYAYFFLDYEQIGYLGVAKWLVIMSIFIIAVSYLLVLIDSKLKKK